MRDAPSGVFAICFLFSVIVGIVAGLIHHKPTTPKGPAFLYSGGSSAAR